MRYFRSTLFLLFSVASTSAWADCRSPDFDAWLSDFKQEAAASGISAATLDNALTNIRPDPSVIQRDRSQGVFAQTFLEFSSKKVNSNRMNLGRANIAKNGALFSRIEQQFGVPAEILAAFWGLETDFGAVTGDFPTIRSLVTLAHDCRRPDLFRPELMHALQLVQKGDQTPASMRGAWAGELGQMQFIPSSYNKFGIDFDGDGHRDLIHSRADALASGASMLRNYGWRAGEPWLREVRVPKDMDWSLARLDNKLPISEWAAQGVTTPSGKALNGGGSAALLLPMGRLGPAFLAYPNFDVLLQWNESTVYTTTAAYFATRLAGAGAMSPGNGLVPKLSLNQVRDLQARLQARGMNVGKIDGIIGEQTRAAVRSVQKQLGLPADGYPDPSLLSKL
ncbi:lytic murein transglycosylase [Thiolinea disciformis]|uniref:lytic murein transglycosylase n=1 Tax=Thiolinea disciformis TaxID=125614 RepID=UPI0003607631|nr:lytic murein transglycosylase [Thiolinea disciformis]